MSLLPNDAGVRPVNPILSKVVAGYANDSRYLADSVVPILFDGSNVAPGGETYTTGTIQRMAAGAMFGDPTRRRVVARGERYPRAVGAGMDPLTFECEKYGGEAVSYFEDEERLVTNGMLTNATVQLQAEMHTQKILREQAYADLFFNTANWPTNLQTGVGAAPGANQFLGWNIAGSDPNVTLAESAGRVDVAGNTANTCVIGFDAYQLMRTHTAFSALDDVRLDRTVSDEDRVKRVLASRFGLTKVSIGKAVMNTNPDPKTAPVLVRIWNDSVWMGYTPDGITADDIARNIAVESEDGLLVTTPTAVGKVVPRKWSVMEYPEYQTDAMVFKIRYMEWIGVVLERLGALITNVRA